MHSVIYDPNEGGFVPNKAHKPVSHEHAHH
jgi:hypothetical protein